MLLANKFVPYFIHSLQEALLRTKDIQKVLTRFKRLGELTFDKKLLEWWYSAMALTMKATNLVSFNFSAHK